MVSPPVGTIEHFRYIKIHTWLRGLGEENKRIELFIAEPQDDSPNPAAKYIGIGLFSLIVFAR